MLTFQKRYFIFAILLFLTEVFIAMYIDDAIIRPYVGDFLVVILIYCFVKSFFDVPVIQLAISVLLFAYTIELLQYLKFVQLLGLSDNKIARVVLGSSFAWIDLLAYTLGAAAIIAFEKRSKKSIANSRLQEEL